MNPNIEYAPELSCDSQAQIASFWEMAKLEAENLKSDQSSFKAQDLPLARIKKIMKLDDDVKSMMISAEAPILFAKAAELFIRDLTLRSWMHTERNRRRTLQRNDVSMAVSYGDTDIFDFLIDIVPRDESRSHRRSQNLNLPPLPATQSVQQMGGDSTMKTDAVLLSGTNGNLSFAGGSDMCGVAVADTSGLAVIGSSSSAIGLLQQQQQTFQLAGLSSDTSNSIQALSANQIVSAAMTTPSTTCGSVGQGQQIQYVFQLPVGNAPGGASTGQSSFQIQMLPHHFQAGSSDVLAATPGTLIAGPSGGLQMVQVMAPQNTGLAFQSSLTGQEGAGTRLQTIHLQIPDIGSGVSVPGTC